MRRDALYLLGSAILLFFATTSPAAARDYEDGIDPFRLYGGLWLGFNGDADIDGDHEFAGDLKTTVGGQVGVDAVVLRHLSLGGEARFGAVRWKVGDSSKLIDLDFKPRLRFPLRSAPVEFYATVPVGITIPRVPDNAPDAKTGWNFGAGAGINFFFTKDIGINAEPMWLMHDFGDYRLKQFSLFLNLVLAL